MSTHERALLGEPLADKLLVVRYPSHRRFLAMVLNPYYFAINEFRERGVTRFEASFTKVASRRRERPRRARGGSSWSTIVLPTRSPEIRAALEQAVGPLVYASSLVQSMTMLAPPRPTDPNPISLPQTRVLRGGVCRRRDRRRSSPTRLARRVPPRSPCSSTSASHRRRTCRRSPGVRSRARA